MGGRQHQGAAVAEHRGPTGVGEHGTRPEGPPGTWEALTSPPEDERPHAERDEKGVGWYRITSQRECCGKEAGSRSAPVGPVKRGNHPEGPRGGKERAGSVNRRRER